MWSFCSVEILLRFNSWITKYIVGLIWGKVTFFHLLFHLGTLCVWEYSGILSALRHFLFFVFFLLLPSKSWKLRNNYSMFCHLIFNCTLSGLWGVHLAKKMKAKVMNVKRCLAGFVRLCFIHKLGRRWCCLQGSKGRTLEFKCIYGTVLCREELQQKTFVAHFCIWSLATVDVPDPSFTLFWCHDLNIQGHHFHCGGGDMSLISLTYIASGWFLT